MKTHFRILLFDVDGTLVDSMGAGRRALVRVFEELWGIPDAFNGYGFSGRTDKRIVRDAFERHLHRLPTEREEADSLHRYLDFLAENLADPALHVRVLPGIEPLLQTLSGIDLPLGLATGNLQRGAYLKLAAGKLDRYFPFGGFGSDAEDRTLLTQIAAERGRAHVAARHPGSAPVADSEILVIGDSPLDIEAARGAGLRVLAVASGWSTLEELRSGHPDFLLEDLGDRETVRNILGF